MENSSSKFGWDLLFTVGFTALKVAQGSKFVGWVVLGCLAQAIAAVPSGGGSTG